MYVVAITGASGSIIGIRLAEFLLKFGKDVDIIVSEAGWLNICFEILGFSAASLSGNANRPASVHDVLRFIGSDVDLSRLREFACDDWRAPCASGSASVDAVIVAPCSMKTLSAIANGYGDSLITRSADTALKESRKVILIPRETPVSLIHLENMVKAKYAGADILLPVPGFYTHPKSIDDVVNFIAGKALNLLGIKHDIFTPWGGET